MQNRHLGHPAQEKSRFLAALGMTSYLCLAEKRRSTAAPVRGEGETQDPGKKSNLGHPAEKKEANEMSDRKSPPFIPKKHRDGAEITEKREGWGTPRFGG